MKHYLYRLWLVIAALVLIAGCTTQQKAVEPAETLPSTGVDARSSNDIAGVAKSESRVSRPSSDRLGTQWGEGIDSRVTTVDLRRISSKPVDVTQIFYAASRQSGRSVNEAMIANGRIGISVLNDRRAKWPLTRNGNQFYLKGVKGERYELSYRNYSNKTYEIVATVDGLDVINGSAGSLNNSGYVLGPYSTLTIEGFRKNSNEVAAFRFSAASDAYAANTPAGSVRNTGVIGTAVFELNAPKVTQPRPTVNQPQAFPGDAGGFAPPPRYGN